MKHIILVLVILLLIACNSDENNTPVDQSPGSPNILLIIADDMGKDATSGFSEGSIKPNTPNLNKLKNDGLTFTNTWVYPTCSPTRASIITGKYGYRTGVKWANDELSTSEKLLQQYIDEETNNAYETAIIGKWHLSGNDNTVNPETFGLDYYAGLIRGGVQNYYQWQLNESGTTSMRTDYPTEVFTDLAIDWVRDQTKPWFLWLAYNAPHTPFHVPPNEMHTQGDLPEYTEDLDAMPYYLAAIEAIDFQIGRLIESMEEEELENTIIIFVGDNGTPGQVAQSPYSGNTAKGSLYQGGVNVPMFFSGKGVDRQGEDENLITSTDLFSTIAEIAGVEVDELHDSKSFKSLLISPSVHRDFQYSEMTNTTDELWAISNGSYKLIVNANGDEEMYHLSSDPYEVENLLDASLSSEQQNAKTELEAELVNIRN
ncbi:MAG: sulfatase-like hydrolase/transferase [Bacteroidota bacterium]